MAEPNKSITHTTEEKHILKNEPEKSIVEISQAQKTDRSSKIGAQPSSDDVIKEEQSEEVKDHSLD